MELESKTPPPRCLAANANDGDDDDDVDNRYRLPAAAAAAASADESPSLMKFSLQVPRVDEILSKVSRVTRSKADARSTYNTLSKVYDLLTASSEKEYTEKGVVALDAQPGETVLDIGCGTGFALELLAKRVAGTGTGRVIGIDVSDGMLAKADARLKAAQLRAVCELHCGDALEELRKLEDKSVDAVLMSFFLELLDNDDIAPLLREVVRVTRHGGRIVCVALARKIELASVQLYEWFHEKMPNFVDCRPLPSSELLGALEASGVLRVAGVETYKMWRLPVEVVTATRCDPTTMVGSNASFRVNRGGVVPRSAWENDDERETCACCRERWRALWRRRGHCRRCGRLVCSACTKSTLMISDIDPEKPSKICTDCAKAVRGF